jgi:hypothetical protein
MTADEIMNGFFSVKTSVTVVLTGPNYNDEMSVNKPLHIHESPNAAKIA